MGGLLHSVFIITLYRLVVFQKTVLESVATCRLCRTVRTVGRVPAAYWVTGDNHVQSLGAYSLSLTGLVSHHD